jgi:uncharacterized protein YbcV (DUF1398 family)
MNHKVIKETVLGSLSGTITFPQVVGKLLAEGIESYHVDLVRSENRYYMPSGETHVEKVSFDHSQAESVFSSLGVQSAIKAIQNNEINYVQFVNQVLHSGCVYYIAYLSGRQVVYFGRRGEMHIERFPDSK